MALLNLMLQTVDVLRKENDKLNNEIVLLKQLLDSCRTEKKSLLEEVCENEGKGVGGVYVCVIDCVSVIDYISGKSRRQSH